MRWPHFYLTQELLAALPHPPAFAIFSLLVVPSR